MSNHPRPAQINPAILDELRTELLALRASEAQYRALFELMPSSVVLLDAQGVIRDANPVFCRNMGYSREELAGMPICRFSQESPEVIAANLAGLLAGLVLDHEVTNVQKDGSLRYFQLRETAVTLPDGSRGILAVSNDITERKQVEQQREKLIQELQQLLAEVKTLSGLLPICAGCKKVRDDKGYWNQIESYITQHSQASFTHGLCPSCAIKTLERGGMPVPDGIRKEAGEQPEG